ncbi:MAG: tetratricopeptide repeat protein [Acidobacteria bacterium]|nr:tetratricopeptide repeat protein [Acidobacteriota bacterium]
MARAPIDRRQFLAAAAGGVLLRDPAWSETPAARFRQNPPFEALRSLIDPAGDVFPGEAAALARQAAFRPDAPGRILHSRADSLPAGLRQESTSRTPDGLEFRTAGPGAPPRIERARDPWFREITEFVFARVRSFEDQLRYGIPHWAARLDPATGIDLYGNQGIAAGDIDGDGIDEIYVCQPGGLPNRLYKFRDGRMTDITETAGVGLLDDSACALFLDLRNLGRQDLVVLRTAGPVLLLNDGTGRFTLRKDAFRFARAPQGGFTGMAAADYDRDGKLDLYCCCYSFFQSEAQYRYPVPYHDARNGPPNFLFRNRLTPEGSGGFEDVTSAAGLDSNNDRFSFAPAWCDYDGRGWPSLYVANDFGRNNLYHNDRGKFTDVAAQAGVEDLGPGMSACWFDENGDGRPDLYVANMWTAAGQRLATAPQFTNAKLRPDAYRRHTKGNSLYQNLGSGRFQEVNLGAEMGRWAWSATAHDFDGDGQPELYVACGMLSGLRQPDLASFFWRQVVARSPVEAQANEAYENGWNAINQFLREGYPWHGGEANILYARRGGEYRDLSGLSGLQIAGDTRAFAVTDLDGDGRLDVILKNRLGPQVRVFQNNCARPEGAVLIRLEGTRSNRDAVGAKVRVGGLTQWLAAGSGYLSQHSKKLHFGLKPGERATLTVTWPSGTLEQFGEITAGREYTVREGSGRAEPRAFSPVRDLPEGSVAGDDTARLHDTWLRDPVPLPERAPGPGLVILHGRETPTLNGHRIDLAANPDRAALYALFRRYLFEYRAPLELPLALLVDNSSRVRKIYAAMPSEAAVQADLARLEQPLAIPFPGHEVSPAHRDYFKLGAALLWGGYREEALPYLEAVTPPNARTLVLMGQIHHGSNRLDDAEAALRRALELDPAGAEAWNELGGVAASRGDQKTAALHYEKALMLKPDLVYALLNAGQTYDKLGDFARSEETYRRVLRRDANSAEAANGLGLALAKQRKFGEARQFLLRAVELKRDYGAAINNLAVLYLQMGQSNDAIAALRYGIEVSPDEDSLYMNLGRYYLQAGERDRARAVMRQLLQRKPGHTAAARALRELDQP